MTDTKADSLRDKDLENLYVDTLLVKPVDHSWENYESFEVIQPFDSDDQRFKEEAEKYNCDADDLYFEACDSNYPMMCYYYPLPSGDSFDEEDAKKIEHLNLCLVHFHEDGKHALALTGGGMDFSWDIVEAYIRLGYYPPVHFRLPRFAGLKHTVHRETIIQACVKGREIVKGWMNKDTDDLKRVREFLLPTLNP